MSVLEIVFVGQCEVFVCLDFLLTFFFLLAAKLIGPRMERQFFKNVDFSVTYPFKVKKKGKNIFTKIIASLTSL